jgi:flagellar motor switch protein FliG
MNLSRIDSLDPQTVEAIGETLTRDFLATHAGADQRCKPADQAGAIMNYASTEAREQILGCIETNQPELAGAIRRKMFTVEDIPVRVPARAAPAVIRSIGQETLLKVLFVTRDTAPEVGEFLLSNISSRMAERLREELKQITSVRRKDGERAQAEIIRVIRELAARGEIELIEEEEA